MIGKDLEDRVRNSATTKSCEVLSGLVSHRGTDTPLYVFGRNIDSESLISALTGIAGFIDDFAPPDTAWHGIPVVPLAEVDKNATIINAVTNSRPLSADARLRREGYQNVFFLNELCEVLPEAVPKPEFVLESGASFRRRQEDWQSLFDRLKDSESRGVLLDILAYRVSGDPRILSEYRYRPEEQYFEDFLGIESEIFIDGGGYDGATAKLFCERYPDYSAVHVFEPDTDNFALCNENLGSLRDIHFHQCALSDSSGTLRFDPGNGSASAVSDDGVIELPARRLEDEVEAATFIKLDLEGWELAALRGAENLIRHSKPKLAIGAYHAADDMLDVAQWVLDVREDYRVSVRHYTESWTETVLYFY